ncbi:MAG: hypothetical protein IH988_00050 [Planctomycetes bacterium]|nr:hypothetical protein [Planctomycetota bacterium]
MSRHPRIRRIAKWIGVVVCVGLFCGWIDAGFRMVVYQTSTRSVNLWIGCLFAVAFATAYLFYRDRNRRHPPGHCKKCGYDLQGNVSGVCPECGSMTSAR